MRTDAYQVRARELCTAAGIEPDSRVGEGRGRPAWCDYRDAARKEHLKREVEATAAVIAAKAQPEQYQNSPLIVVGDHEASTIDQMKNCMKVGNVVQAVICADGHLGYSSHPVGGVVAYEDQVSISGVGVDIACGNKAIRLDVKYDEIKDRVGEIMRKIPTVVSFGVGRINNKKVDHELFDDKEAWKNSGMGHFLGNAREQLGTVGGGNHYVDLMRDEAGWTWVGVHFGSRGLGYNTAKKYRELAGATASDGPNSTPVVVDVASDVGTQYLHGMHLAGRFAYAGRDWVCEAVHQIVGGNITDEVHNHHNFAWLESHPAYPDKKLWVVRKGATPAFEGQRGFVGGSMGDDAVIISGTGSVYSHGLLQSTVHGAGRTMGRKDAKRRFTREQMDKWLIDRGVHLIGGDLDESPMAYRRLPEVLKEQGNTINILHTLRPFGVVMAGAKEVDPYKD